ncbi:hypothetical protein ACFY19_20770 [Streptosporangium saharense]|uniref:hypothetical protein n=1 Tax=Streptosporangium saharense TaxID=1706840 RepID=UPI0036A59F05
MLTTVYVVIGDRDRRLTDAGWATYCADVTRAIEGYAVRVHGTWRSDPTDTWRSACFAVRVALADADQLKAALTAARTRHAQRSIAWAEAETTLFL